jgi:hypothetical protein
MTEVDDRRSIPGDGSRETDDNQSPFLYEATKLQSSANLKTYGVPAAWLDSEHYSEYYFEIPNYAATCPSCTAEYDPGSDPESHSYNADTQYHEALPD